tara:strand:- start:4071 stop:4385 length:315 start_codon:yes stop_codon:yes gene_type:complete
MKALKNTHDPLEEGLSLNEQLEQLAEQFGSGMDYGFKAIEPRFIPETGYYEVDLVCRQGAVASDRFRWNPLTQTSLWMGVSTDDNNFFIPQNMINEFSDNLVRI